MAKQGRPRGLNINPIAVMDLLNTRSMTQRELADAAGITPGHLADMLSSRSKGTSATVVRKMAEALLCRPETIAPELTHRFVAVRSGDTEAA